MTADRNKRSTRRHGVVIVYIAVVIVLLFGMVSLVIDLARVRLARTQLQGAADASARAAAAHVPNGATAAQTAAIAAAASNSADGSAVTISSSDVVVGVWDTSAHTFTPTNTSPNAVKVTVQRTAAAGNAIPLLFARVLGRTTCDIHVSAIAMVNGTAPIHVDGVQNLWLAGMPNGNYGGAAVSGTAPENSPTQVTGITITPGGSITFQVNGSCSDDPINVNKAWTPDGQSDGTGIRTNDSGYLNGMSNLSTQQGALIGVFLNNSAPNSGGSTPSQLNQDTAATMDYTTLSPALKQPFFIGNGKKGTSGAQQNVVVPAGATRLFIGVHDNINWINNSGYFLVSFNGSGATNIIIVK